MHMVCSCFSPSHTGSLCCDQINSHLPFRQLRPLVMGGGLFYRTPDSSRVFFPLPLTLCDKKMRRETDKYKQSVLRLWTMSPSSCTSWPWRRCCYVWRSPGWRSTRARKQKQPWRSSRPRGGGWPSRRRSWWTTWKKTEQRTEAAVHR